VHGPVFEETDGHPFFVAEVLRHLAESGAIEQRDGRWVATTEIEALGIPEGVRDVIGRRLSRLSDTANRVLALASVVGLEFDADVLRTAAATAEDELFGALDEAAAARLVSEVPGVRYRFAHALVRTTLYDELSGARRVSLHRRVAEAIETVHSSHLDNHLPALAYHWARAAAPAAESAKAVEYASRSGDQALAQLAHDQAAVYYRESLGLLDAAGVAAEDGRRLELLISLGEAQRRAGDAGYRETLLEAANLARQHRDAPALARAALANNRGFHSAAERIDAERVQVLEAALESIPSDDSGIRARLLAILASELGWEADGRRRLTLASEALAMARRLADLPTLGQVLALRMTVVPYVEPVETRAEIAELETVADRLQDPALAFWAAIWGFQMALQVGDIVWFNAALESAGARAAELNQPFLEWCSAMTRATQSLVHGRLDEAEENALRCFEIGHSAGIPDASYVFGAQRFWILHERGRLEELIPTLSKATARPDPNALSRAAFAVALAELGRADEARAVIDDLAADGFASLPSNYSALYGLTLAAAGCAAARHVEAAATLTDRLGPHRGLVAHGGAVATGSVDHFLGLLAVTLGDLDEAEIHFREAARIHESFGAPTWLARTRLEWARMLLTRGATGDDHRARSLLEQALTTATDLGLANVERSVRTLLDDAHSAPCPRRPLEQRMTQSP